MTEAAALAPHTPYCLSELFTNGEHEDFLCGICLDIMQDPHSCCTEGHTYCLTCIRGAMISNQSNCPSCRQGISNLMKNRYLQNAIDNSTVRCPHGEHNSTSTENPLKKQKKAEEATSSASPPSAAGCSWRGLFKDLSRHLGNDCEFVICKCSFSTCFNKVMRKDLPAHHLNCVRRPCICELGCGNINMENSHMHKLLCPEIEVVCSNREVRNDMVVQVCEQKYKRKDTNMHKSVCKLETVCCIYAPFGCETQVLRKDMNQHLVEEAMSHAVMSMSNVTSQSVEKHVIWKVDPINDPDETNEVLWSSKSLFVGHYRCELSMSETDGIYSFILNLYIHQSENKLLFPVSIVGSNITIVHPSNELESKFGYFNVDLEHIFGPYFMSTSSRSLTIAEIPYFVSNTGELTIKATIRMTPPVREVSLN
jgi:hypothetical protein